MAHSYGHRISIQGGALQNAQVERYNETVAIIVRNLLYGAQLPAKFWSVATIYTVCLMKRHVHGSIGITPYKAWCDELQFYAFSKYLDLESALK